LVLSAFTVIIVFLGVYPAPLLDLVNTPVRLLTGGSGGLP
jgi:NADH:ubiquinone oxidoreductase subunit 4 (subunit M)